MKIPGRNGSNPSVPQAQEPSPKPSSRPMPSPSGKTPQATSQVTPPRLSRPAPSPQAAPVTHQEKPAAVTEESSQKSSRMLIFALLGLLLLGSAGAGWGALKYNRTKAGYEQQVAELEQTLGQARRRQAEEQARADQAQRLNDNLKGQLAELQSEFDTLLATKQASSSQSQKLIAQLKRQLNEWQQEAEKRAAANLKLQGLNDQQKTEIGKLRKEGKKLAARNKSLEKKLKYAKRKIETIIGHNVELSKAAIKLLDAYENKGVFSALASNEPLTGVGRVKLEHAIQDYRQHVSKHTVEDTR